MCSFHVFKQIGRIVKYSGGRFQFTSYISPEILTNQGSYSRHRQSRARRWSKRNSNVHGDWPPTSRVWSTDDPTTTWIRGSWGPYHQRGSSDTTIAPLLRPGLSGGERDHLELGRTRDKQKADLPCGTADEGAWQLIWRARREVRGILFHHSPGWLLNWPQAKRHQALAPYRWPLWGSHQRSCTAHTERFELYDDDGLISR